jgi:hypothetical protein
MATAQVLFHRFYYRRSFRRFDVQESAMAALFLATKSEEKERKIRDFINTFHYIFEKRDGKKWVPLDVTTKVSSSIHLLKMIFMLLLLCPLPLSLSLSCCFLPVVLLLYSLFSLSLSLSLSVSSLSSHIFSSLTGR